MVVNSTESASAQANIDLISEPEDQLSPFELIETNTLTNSTLVTASVDKAAIAKYRTIKLVNRTNNDLVCNDIMEHAAESFKQDNQHDKEYSDNSNREYIEKDFQPNDVSNERYESALNGANKENENSDKLGEPGTVEKEIEKITNNNNVYKRFLKRKNSKNILIVELITLTKFKINLFVNVYVGENTDCPNQQFQTQYVSIGETGTPNGLNYDQIVSLKNNLESMIDDKGLVTSRQTLLKKTYLKPGSYVWMRNTSRQCIFMPVELDKFLTRIDIYSLETFQSLQGKPFKSTEFTFLDNDDPTDSSRKYHVTKDQFIVRPKHGDLYPNEVTLKTFNILFDNICDFCPDLLGKMFIEKFEPTSKPKTFTSFVEFLSFNGIKFTPKTVRNNLYTLHMWSLKIRKENAAENTTGHELAERYLNFLEELKSNEFSSNTENTLSLIDVNSKMARGEVSIEAGPLFCEKISASTAAAIKKSISEKSKDRKNKNRANIKHYQNKFCFQIESFINEGIKKQNYAIEKMTKDFISFKEDHSAKIEKMAKEDYSGKVEKMAKNFISFKEHVDCQIASLKTELNNEKIAFNEYLKKEIEYSNEAQLRNTTVMKEELARQTQRIEEFVLSQRTHKSKSKNRVSKDKKKHRASHRDI